MRSTPSVAPCSRGPEQADNNSVAAHPPKIQNFFIFKLFYRCEKIPSTAPKDKVQTSVDRHTTPHLNLIRHPLFFTFRPCGQGVNVPGLKPWVMIKREWSGALRLFL